MKEFLRILKYARPYLPRLLFGFFLILIIAQSQLFMPLVQRFVIDDILSDVKATELTHSVFGYHLTYSPTHWLIVILSTIITFYALVGLISYVRTIVMEWVSQRILFDMRNQVFSHLQKLSMRFYDVQGTGQILSRVKEDVSSLRSLVTDTSIDILTDMMMFVTVVFIMFRWSWKLTLISLLILPLVAGNYFFFIGRLRVLWRHLRHRWADISTELYESVAGAKVVKAFHRENHQKRRVFRGMRQTLKWQIAIAKYRAAMGRISGFFQSFGTAIVLCYGGYLVIQGEFTIGTLVAYYQFLGRLYGPMMKLININATIQEAMVSSERVFGLLDSQPTVDEVPDAVDLPEIRGHVKFENVTFYYEPENPVLHHISFDAKPDMMVALVGPSGCGKSTISNLIARFYDPTEGTIYIDDHDLCQVTLKSLRNQIGIVLQDNFLFQGSVAENIQFGRLDATEIEVVEASLAANAHQFVVEELPGGYEAEVGERGMRLSGGQKQRIAIARTILRNPRILILDEATSSLDSESESLIQEALDTLMKGRTTFVIAHRLSTILKADMILVMKDGGITEKGTHEQLLELNGLYANMYQKQFKTKPQNIDWLN
ncbi:TPA: ABC transporter ATP-binding protein [Candidatus Poribacteria bacterium]|nr:ABC transporter ATP-binding protein [Candidatus Poribacteria bacterium]HIA67508.1 ABC transporter ATP-binding protein [Candidatus Poribacteria bacterium]HIC00762.1 ABC transporter ATP-binding protein [Candidatus Poribacteria bacterium]HIN30745.1 ABC transporter ATP-binding protein [Candidatus Poribacteria bacterium]HIO48373.1 ABC transporter ATP-binding protein [Candidatus Poribacteria bacterium]